MSRYIDADALITDLNKGLWGKDWDKVLAEAIINEAPSIDIVRCKECKYAHMTYGGECKYCDKWSPGDSLYLDGDFFCSYGCREEE